MNLLVTGNLGFIGPIVVRQARERGHRVIGFDVGYFADCLGAGLDEEVVDRQIWRDIRDAEVADLAGADAVIHLAGLSNDVLGEINPRLTDEINRVATVRLARLAKTAGVPRFVFASSCAVYGRAAEDSPPLGESAALNPLTPYAASKAGAEAGLAELADDDFTPVCLRFGTAFGVSSRTRFDLVVNNLAGFAHASGVVRVMSDGRAWKPLIHIEDIAESLLLAATTDRPAVHNLALNVGRSDTTCRVASIAETVARAFPRAELRILGEADPDQRSYRVDFSRITRALGGYTPRWTVERGVDQVARFLRDGGLGGEDFNAARFVRLARIKQAMTAGELDHDLRIVGGRTLTAGRAKPS